ncbi:predicted protein [Nematostella vectensis]|uniref:SCP domain-containing protein n=3 Tax=Nematostella vectensis TaxID=45351 RepID=A7SL03_NEMVE|nr:predicted protein [Nematostella vectensis]|eukprot:XP_001627707.1 predicted protein [Nematostella vectensis]
MQWYLVSGICVALVAILAGSRNVKAVRRGFIPPYFPQMPQMPYQWPQPMQPQMMMQQQPPQPAKLENTATQRSPILPGTPMWKRMKYIERYNAMQRSRDSGIYSEPTGKGSPSAFEKRVKGYINLHRLLHKTGTLELDHKMSLQSAKYAREIAKSMRVEHSTKKSRHDQSESIAIGCKVSGPGLTGFEAVKYWYQTVCHNNWVSPGLNDKSRPFTNMIWKSSKRLGIGRASFKTKGGYNCTVMVARYSPEGSRGGSNKYSDNVNQGHYVPTSCQYTNSNDKPDFIQPSLKCSKTSKDFHGQMVEEDSSCTISELFATFGASKRKGKLAFRVVL